MENYMIWIWLAVVCVSLIYEFISVGSLTSLWFAIGGIVAIILSALKVDILIQVIVFVSVSFVFLISLRKLALKYLFSKKQEKLNTDAFIGNSYILNGDIDSTQSGTVSINGVVWTCIAENPQIHIKDGTTIIVKEIRGNKLIVAKK